VRRIVCVGPTDWLLIAPDPDAAAWLQQCDAAFKASLVRAADVSQALACIEIEGPEVRDLFAKGFGIDVRPSHFAPGRSTQSRFAGMPVIVCCRGFSKFECVVTLSHADYLLSWLADVTLEFESTT
jgi:heterotetrameric sarcosine oxidase gamma subunit